MAQQQMYHGLKNAKPKTTPMNKREKKPANMKGMQPCVYPKGKYPA